MKQLEVTVEREGRWWVFTIPDLNTGGQAKTLTDVEHEAQGVAAMWLDVEPSTITVTVQIGGAAALAAKAEWSAAENDEEAARAAQSQAGNRRREVIKELRRQNISAVDVGRILGISKQRVYQLEK